VDRVLGLKPEKEDRFDGFEVDIELGHPDHEGVSQESSGDGGGDVITGSEDSEDSDDDGSDGEPEKIFDGEDDEGKE